MKREFEIHVHLDTATDYKDRAFNRMASLVFQSAKDSVGLIMSEKKYHVHIVYGYGKHSDAIRVYSAIKRNKYIVVFSEGV